MRNDVVKPRKKILYCNKKDYRETGGFLGNPMG
jgi:hypothetical protein